MDLTEAQRSLADRQRRITLMINDDRGGLGRPGGVTINGFIQQYTDLRRSGLEIVEDVEAAGGEISRAQKGDLRTVIHGMDSQIEKIQKEIEFTNAVMAAPIVQSGPGDTEGGRFDSTEGFIVAVMNAGSKTNPQYDPRLFAGAPTTYGQTGVGEEGGYLIPGETRNEIINIALGNDALLPRTTIFPIDGNTLYLPLDEDQPWDTTGGIFLQWEAEAAAATQRKPKLKTRSWHLYKLMGLVPVTNELVEDSSSLAQWLPKKLGEAMLYKVNDAILNGSGAGQPVGIINSGALVSVAKESGQAADTLVIDNIAKMYARASNPSRCIWIMNQDVMPQLITMVLANQPIWHPAGPEAPSGTLFGRPIVLSISCQAIGSKGDIFFADMASYYSVTKRGQPKIDTSMHLYFDADSMAFRIVFRMDGQPALSAAITPPNSSDTRSPFVTLDERA